MFKKSVRRVEEFCAYKEVGVSLNGSKKISTYYLKKKRKNNSISRSVGETSLKIKTLNHNRWCNIIMKKAYDKENI